MIEHETKRYLIVNADDFGMSDGVNDGVMEAHERGIVTSASLMVRWPAAAAAVALQRTSPCLGLGLHIDLGEWTFSEGAWSPLYEVVPLTDPSSVATEIGRQLDEFRRIVGSNPTHLDSHQHVHRDEPVRGVLMNLARDLGIPLRHFHAQVRYCGDFYGQTADGRSMPEALGVPALIGLLEKLPPGITELACHPGRDGNLRTMYCSERFLETQTLTCESVRSTIRELAIQLGSFQDFANHWQTRAVA